MQQQQQQWLTSNSLSDTRLRTSRWVSVFRVMRYQKYSINPCLSAFLHSSHRKIPPKPRSCDFINRDFHLTLRGCLHIFDLWSHRDGELCPCCSLDVRGLVVTRRIPPSYLKTETYSDYCDTYMPPHQWRHS